MPNIFADVPAEGNALDIDKSFERLSTKDKADKPATDSQPEKKETVKEPSQKGEPDKDNTSDEKTPFHKHPRWIKTQETLKEYEKRVEAYETRIKALESSKDGTTEPLPQWWKERYGEDDKSKNAFKDYQAATKAERDRIKDEVKQDILKEQEAEKNRKTGGDEYITTQMAEMKEEGLEFERNELLKFMVDFQKDFGAGSLIDKEGNYDFRKSLALMQKMQPKQPDNSIETKKKIAADTMKSKVKAPSASNIPTISRKALRGNWRDSGL